ncbi:MAG: hypothetical protein EHM42_11915 [Planctomycetaceae bacterium]|nr:MAG: hypothetical protein EHM42_11915 [Planctomycetaceae bacterium]
MTEPRERFNVAQLMECAEASLRGQGLLGPLAHAWNRIQTVAPLVRETITQQQSAGHAAARPVWHAEALLEILKSAGFTDLTFRESHLGNCATIFGRKPLASIG